MDFAFDATTQELREKLLAFMDEHVHPAQAVMAEQHAKLDSPWQTPPVVEAEARAGDGRVGAGVEAAGASVRASVGEAEGEAEVMNLMVPEPIAAIRPPDRARGGYRGAMAATSTRTDPDVVVRTFFDALMSGSTASGTSVDQRT